MITVFSSNYIARKPIEKAMRKFASNFKQDQKILDIGCGKKPYAKFFSCQYVGLDPFEEVDPDIMANAWKIPVPDNSFDGVVLNQSLEHIEKTAETVCEIKRVLKPGGIAIITAPQTMKVHSIPMPLQDCPFAADLDLERLKMNFWNNDFYRFTKFGLIILFRDFEIISLKESNGYFGTIFQLINYFFSSFKIKFLAIPIYLLNNILGCGLDYAFGRLSKLKTAARFNELIYQTLTLNYILIIKKRD